MKDSLLTWNLACLFPMFLLFLSFSAFAGNFLGNWFRSHPQVKAMRISDIVPSAILGLLGLLLGFTFSMAVSRFEMRRDLIVQEVNAIGTTYLRTQLLPEAQGAASRAILRSYVDARLQYFEEDPDHSTPTPPAAKAHAAQQSLWQQAIAASKTDKGPLIALYVTSLNELIDVYAASLMAMNNHVPEVVYLAILVAAFFGLLTLGYSQGVEQRLGYLGNFLLSLLFAIVILLIMDVDRPRGGLIQISRENMHTLHNDISQ